MHIASKRDTGKRIAPIAQRKTQPPQVSVMEADSDWGRGSVAPSELLVIVNIGDQPKTFLVDTGANFSLLKQDPGPTRRGAILVQGATGYQTCKWTTEGQVDLGSKTVTHSFPIMPECPYPGLLGRDLLHKLLL